jgi:adenosylcobyric acid synthase
VSFPRLSNGTDFRLLSWADWLSAPSNRQYDFVILPGTKDTIADLSWMRDRGLDVWVHEQHKRGAMVIGICGGFQMLGEEIRDPDGLESTRGSARGLGLLPVETVLVAEKATALRRATIADRTVFQAYEIHLGITTRPPHLPPFARLDDGTVEGIWADRVVGTYLHGALEDAAVCSHLFGIQVADAESKAQQYAGLADWFERYAEEPEQWLT